MALLSQNYNLSLVSLLLCFLFVINPNSAISHDTEARINYICRQMEEFGFCNQTFIQNLKTPSTDYVGLTEIATLQAIQNATSTHDFIEELQKTTSDAALKTILATCEHGYLVVEQAFEDGYKAFLDKDYNDMQIDERVAPRAEGSCDQVLAVPPHPTTNPLIERNREMRILIAMALVSGNQLLPHNS